MNWDPKLCEIAPNAECLFEFIMKETAELQSETQT